MRWPSLALTALGLWSCAAESPPRGPEQTCVYACLARAARAGVCTASECRRGCNLVLDRLVEHEGEHVIACIGRGEGRSARATAAGDDAPSSGGRCDDRRWAYCATRIGPYADGGPPAPPPPRDDPDDEP